MPRKSRSQNQSGETAFLCQACRHLGGWAFRIYSLAFPLAKRSGVFFASACALAFYFGCSTDVIYRALAELREKGFFVPLEREFFETTKYRVLAHCEWEREHPGQCAVKREAPASGRADPLVSKLWGVSGGRVQFFPSQLAEARRLVASDAEIETEFARFWETRGEAPGRQACRKAPGLFVLWLRLAPAERAQKLAAARQRRRELLSLKGHLAETHPDRDLRFAMGVPLAR